MFPEWFEPKARYSRYGCCKQRHSSSFCPSFLINASNASVGHQAAQAFLVAANAAPNIGHSPLTHLFGPLAVGNQLTAHGNTVHTAAGKLLFYKIRVGQSAHPHKPAGRSACVPGHKTAKAAFFLKHRMIGRSNGIGKCAVVCQRYMKAGNPRLFQKRYKHP